MSPDLTDTPGRPAGTGTAPARPGPRRRGLWQRLRQRSNTLVSLAAFAALWEVFARLTPAYVAPTWGRILEAVGGLRLEFVVVTTLRVLAALLASFVIGLLVAVLLYGVRQAEGYVLPLVKLLMAVPVVCWVIFTILWFRTVEYRIFFVLVVVSAPIFVVDLLDAMKGVSKHHREMVRAFRPTLWQYYTKLMLPATVPGILTSWKVNISLAIRVVTIAELVGAVSGIGYGLVIAKELFSMADVFAWTLVLVVLLLLAQGVVDLTERRLLRWRD